MPFESPTLHDRQRLLAGVKAAVVVCGIVAAALLADRIHPDATRNDAGTPNSAIAAPAAAPVPAYAMAAGRDVEPSVRMIDGAPPETSQAF